MLSLVKPTTGVQRKPYRKIRNRKRAWRFTLAHLWVDVRSRRRTCPTEGRDGHRQAGERDRCQRSPSVGDGESSGPTSSLA
jgi:hypothetical protein